MGLVLGTRIKVVKKFDFDNTILIEVEDKGKQTLSNKVAKNINVQLKNGVFTLRQKRD